MNFIVATDGSEASEQAIEYAIEVVDGMDASLTAVYAVEPDVYETQNARDETNAEERLVIEDIGEAEQRGQEALDDAEAFARTHGFGIDTQLLYGKPIEAVPGYAEENEVDGIFVGHRGLSEEHEAVLGSVAKGLVDRAPVPVTIVR